MKDFKRGGFNKDGASGGFKREGGFGDRKPFGDKPAYGSKPAFGGGRSFGKPAFGGSRDGGRPSFDKKPWENRGGSNFKSDKPMYDAVCSNCGNPCQVPFKPNGMKPVLCNNCFAKQNGEEVFVPNNRSEAPRSYDRAPAAKPANDYRIDNIVKQMDQVASKLDTLIGLMSKSAQQPAKTAAPAPVAKVAMPAPAVSAAAPKKAVAKKEVKKAAAKAPAKKAAKKK
ncbi:MAG: hypothetical protein JWM20_433 [Patescibacteria group bacterium]|nr:hypothetical protein [Patescibacteria group bacterium]